MSYRVISKRLWEQIGKRISPRRLCQMVNEVAARAKDSKALQQEYQPQWSGYLQVDDKNLNVQGTQRKSLVGVDRTGDSMHYTLLTEPTQEHYTGFLECIVTELQYPLRGITTDFDPLFLAAVRRVLPGVPHQGCLWHAKELIKALMEYTQTERTYLQLQGKTQRWREALVDHKRYYNTEPMENAEAKLRDVEAQYAHKQAFLRAIMTMLYAPHRRRSTAHWHKLKKQYGTSYPRVVAWIETMWELLLAHHRDPQLAKTNAQAENFNKQLKRRFKTIEGFQSAQTAANYLNLVCGYLRCKPYTDCRGPRKVYNGKAPLELCHVHLHHHEWIKHVVYNA
ncbi:MAG: transposase [Ignavibacteriae bacterium]|nr:transposase [Ignavibacteriota bacterium]